MLQLTDTCHEFVLPGRTIRESTLAYTGSAKVIRCLLQCCPKRIEYGSSGGTMLVTQHVFFTEYIVELVDIYGRSIIHDIIIDIIFKNFKHYNI